MAGRTLKKKIQDSIVSILTRYDAERIAIFGSYARGEAGENSDIGILVRFARPKSLIQLVQIEDEIRAVYSHEGRSGDRKGRQPPSCRHHFPR